MMMISFAGEAKFFFLGGEFKLLMLFYLVFKVLKLNDIPVITFIFFTIILLT